VGIFLVSLCAGWVFGGWDRGEEKVQADEDVSTGSARLTALGRFGRSYSSEYVAQAARPERLSEADLRHLLREMPLGDFPEMAELMVKRYREEGDFGDFRQQFRSLLEIWAERDPQAAVAWYRDGMPNEFDQYVRAGLFRGWGRVDAEGALIHIQKHEGQGWRSQFLGGVFGSVGEVDPELAVRLLNEMKGAGWADFKSINTATMFSLGRYHPELGMEYLLSLDVGSTDRVEGLRAMFSGIVDVETLRKKWEILDDEDRNWVAASVQERLAAAVVEGLSVEEFMEIHNQAEGLYQFDLTDAMVGSNFELFIEFALSDPEGLPDFAYEFIAKEIHSHYLDAETRRAILGELLSSPISESGVESIMGRFEHWEGYDPAFRVLEDLEGDARVSASAALMGSIVRRSIQGALDMRARLADSESRVAAELRIAEYWVGHDTAAALDWVENGEREAGTQEVYSAILPNWASHDPASATAWVAEIPEDDPGRDGLIGNLVRGLEESEEIGAAVEWIGAIGDEQQREELRVELSGGMTPEEFEAEFAEIEREREADVRLTPEEVELYRRLFFGR